MELSVKDRLYLPSFLPARGNFKDFNLCLLYTSDAADE